MKIFRLNIMLFFVFVLASIPCQASHIIGGDLSYLCLGYNPTTNMNRFRITMKIYRNCNRFSMDTFSDPAPITIYSGDGAPYDSVINVMTRLQSPIIPIPPDLSNPCLTLPPDICVQQGTYIFEVDLPVISENYIITYQRCCRNANITNMHNPNMTGATYMIELTPEAQQVCNNSPVFNEFPPIVICANEPIDFDHSATDAEGDQLVYEFCSPLKGAGVGGAFTPGNPFSCTGFMPNPSCAPPYQEVDFTLPTYSPLAPMGGVPLVTIHPTTGLITGIPRVLGQFVVGICVKEYRAGVLLSVTRRDFQFNVADCEPLVDARILADEEIDDQHYLIRSCGETDIVLVNVSQQLSNINSYQWIFDIAGQQQTFSDWSPLVSFPDTGTYHGNLLLNPGSNCSDSANITIEILPEINSDFSFTYDTCVSGPVSFMDESMSAGGPIVAWSWSFEGGGSSMDEDPSHLFTDPGDHVIRLNVEDVNGCRATSVKSINWFPAPALVVIEPSSFVGCEPLDVFFNNLSSPIDETYNIVWDFGDGEIGTAISPAHIYEEPGIYSVNVQITSPLGCYTEESWSNWIRVLPNPVADFTFNPEVLSNFNPVASFTDQSIDAVAWNWEFGGFGSSVLQNPVFSFPDTGRHEVLLTVTHEQGCQDSIRKIIDVEPLITYFLPNAFTPNSDDINDGFRGGGVFVGMTDFRMQIWNRWGEMVFESSSPDNEWNGRKHNNGKLAPNGVYVYIVTFIGPRGRAQQLKGFVTLVK